MKGKKKYTNREYTLFNFSNMVRTFVSCLGFLKSRLNMVKLPIFCLITITNTIRLKEIYYFLDINHSKTLKRKIKINKSFKKLKKIE